MSIYDKMAGAVRSGDVDAYMSLLDDDYVFVRHQSGTTLGRDEMRAMLRSMADSGNWSVDDQRCLYENDDILVTHAKMNFPDGTREAVLSASLKKGGKIYRTETGATPLG